MPKRARDIALVFVGGAAGTGLRYLLTSAFPTLGALPVTFAINVSGALLLGLLTSLLNVRASKRATDLLTLVLGTGFLGGYTTYGMFAVDADGLLIADHVTASFTYGRATVALGFASAAAGVGIGKLLGRRRSAEVAR